MRVKKNNTVVKQAHDLNMAKYHLNSLTLDILHVYLAQINKNDSELFSIKFNIGYLENKLGKQIDRRNLDFVTTELLTTIIRIELGEKKELKTSWCASAIYDQKENTLELEISKYLKDYLLNLKEKFVLSDYKTLSELSGTYTKRIYLMISQYAATGIFRTKVDSLKELLNIEDKYPVYADFKKRVLTDSIKQINNMLDINLIVEEEKNGKKIETLIFKFNKNKYSKIEHKDLVEQWLKEETIIEGNISK